MKVALVELFVDLTGATSKAKPLGEGDAMRTTIKAQRKERLADVLAAIKAAKQAGAELIVFPGWTLYGNDLPQRVLTASHGVTLVLETFVRLDGPNKGARAHVVRDGAEVLTARQCFSQGGHVVEDNALSRRASRLVSEIVGGARDFTVGGKDALLLLCGEINLVGGGSTGPGSAYHRKEVVAHKPPLTSTMLSTRPLVLNPSHTWMGPNASREKRKWLASKGTLLTTANKRTAYWGWCWDKKADDWVVDQKRASDAAARAYRNGKPLPITPAPLAGRPNVTVAYIDVP